MPAKTWGVAALFAAGLTTGCAPTVPVKVEDVTYPSKETAAVAVRRQNDAYLSQLVPSQQRLGGTALVVLPTIASIQRNLPASLSGAAAESTAAIVDVHMTANAGALEKGRIFDRVTVMRADDGEAADFADARYKVWATGTGNNQFKWNFAQSAGGSRAMTLPSGLSRLATMKALNAAVINAAADLGAPVARQEMPQAAPSRVITGSVKGPVKGAVPAKTGPSTGTIFFVDSAGHALTNAHVVDNCKALKVSLPEGRKAEANVAARDKENDLALLTVTPPPGAAFAQLSAAPARQGEEVVVFGFPLQGALSSQGNLTTGIISALVGLREDSRQLQISAPVQPGNSGGPLLDLNGNVIGVVSSKMNAMKMAAATGDIPQNVNFAIKANMVSNFLETNGIKHDRIPAAKVPMSVADVGDKARAFTYMVTCER